jgi:hypothetical protein
MTFYREVGEEPPRTTLVGTRTNADREPRLARLALSSTSNAVLRAQVPALQNSSSVVGN